MKTVPVGKSPAVHEFSQVWDGRSEEVQKTQVLAAENDPCCGVPSADYYQSIPNYPYYP